jgi:hypothetical protein
VAASAKKTNIYTRCVRSNQSLSGGLRKKILTKNKSKKITIFFGRGESAAFPQPAVENREVLGKLEIFCALCMLAWSDSLF